MPKSVPPSTPIRTVRPPAVARLVAALTGVTLLTVPAVAAAHPFGPPLVANVAVDGDTVIVGWGAAEDDWVALGRGLGVLDGPTEEIDPEATVPRTGFERIADSEEVAFYLLDHIGVSQEGAACDGAVSFPGDLGTLLATGVTLQFTCPDHVDAFELTITALTDVHEAYRTVSTLVAAPDVRAVHTLADPTHHVDPDAGGNRIERRHLAGVTAIAALACLALGLTVGRGTRRGAPPEQRPSDPATGLKPEPSPQRDGSADLAGSGAGRDVSS
jgi:hypothetical protein